MNSPLKEPLQKRKRRSIGSIIARLIFSVMALLVIGGISMFVVWTLATADGPLSKEKVVTIPRGSSATDIAGLLTREGVVDSEIMTAAGILAVRHGFNVDPKAGEYAFAARSSLMDVMRKIKSGKTVLYKVSIPEGFTTWQVLERLKANEVLTGEITSVPEEGELLPDTYVFSRGRTRQSIIDQMKAAQSRLMENIWTERAEGLPFANQREALILASIVEKETGQADERAHVAAVFVNRMRQGMRLQSDPTIIYGITKGEGKLNRPIYRSDIRKKTEYNTYQIDGLPPTPIANPGTAAIKAVLNPIETKDLFFVADGTGGHVFAETLAEHNANVRKWRQWVRDQREQAAEDDKQEAEQADKEEAEQQGQAALPIGNEGEAAEAAEAAGAAGAAGQDTQDDNAANTDNAQQQAQNDVASELKPAADAVEPAGDGDEGFRIVKVAGRDVPIPKAKPTR